MKYCENDLLIFIETIHFRTASDKFLNKLNEDINKIRSCLYLLIKPKFISK